MQADVLGKVSAIDDILVLNMCPKKWWSVSDAACSMSMNMRHNEAHKTSFYQDKQVYFVLPGQQLSPAFTLKTFGEVCFLF